jgi:hypothetical protein
MTYIIVLCEIAIALTFFKLYITVFVLRGRHMYDKKLSTNGNGTNIMFLVLHSRSKFVCDLTSSHNRSFV